jgi:uridine kinase
MKAKMERSDGLSEIASVIAEIPLPHPIRVAIDGRDGAGKSTLADELVGPLRSLGREVIRASVDGFHNPREIRYLSGPASPEGFFRNSYNYDALRELLLDPLGPSGPRKYRTAVFDRRSDSPSLSPLKHAAEDAILLFDGIFLLRPELIDYWDFKLFIDVSVEVGLARCAARDGSSADPSAETNKRYVDGQRLYFSECNPKSRAHVIFDNNDTKNPLLRWNSDVERRWP